MGLRVWYVLCMMQRDQNSHPKSMATQRRTRKSTVGRSSNYEGETKTRVTLSVTETGIEGLDAWASFFKCSRSELVEKIGRGLIPLGVPKPPQIQPMAERAAS